MFLFLVLLKDDADFFCKLVDEINSGLSDSAKLENVDKDLMKALAFNARGDICPMQAVIGSIAAQEVMKVNIFLVCRQARMELFELLFVIFRLVVESFILSNNFYILMLWNVWQKMILLWTSLLARL